MQDIFIGRQPIFNRNLEVYAYELLFRSGIQNHAGSFDGDQATSQVIVNAFIEMGLEQLVGKHLAFINLTRSFVTNNTTLPFPKDRVVLEILENIRPDAEVIEGVRILAGQGYMLALDDFIFHEDLKPLLDVAQIIKLDLMAMSRDQLNEHVRLLREYPVQILAEKIETQEEFEHCKQLGFDYFQGYFLSKPNVVQSTQLPPNRLAILQLLSKLQNPKTDAADIEALVMQDVALSYKLLRYINSAFFAFPKKIESIRQAVVYLGTQAIKSWVSLLVVAGLGNKPAELVTQAMQRAKMCELLAKTAKRPQAETYFTVGLFSLLEALMDTPLEKILESLPFTDDVRQGLLEHTGPYGEALACVIAYEKGDFLRAYFDRLAPSQMTDAYVNSAHWADQSASSMSGEPAPTEIAQAN